MNIQKVWKTPANISRVFVYNSLKMRKFITILVLFLGTAFVYLSFGEIESIIMPLALTSLRVPWSQAIIITLAYRGVTFWLPLGMGAWAFRMLSREGN